MTEKQFEQEDPFELVQMYLNVPADDSFYEGMARTFIEEYMKLGFSDEEIFYLFREPFYKATHDILGKKGEDFVRHLIGEVRNGSGV